MTIRYIIMRSDGFVWNIKNENWDWHGVNHIETDEIYYKSEKEAKAKQQFLEKAGINCMVFGMFDA